MNSTRQTLWSRSPPLFFNKHWFSKMAFGVPRACHGQSETVGENGTVSVTDDGCPSEDNVRFYARFGIPMPKHDGVVIGRWRMRAIAIFGRLRGYPIANRSTHAPQDRIGLFVLHQRIVYPNVFRPLCPVSSVLQPSLHDALCFVARSVHFHRNQGCMHAFDGLLALILVRNRGRTRRLLIAMGAFEASSAVILGHIQTFPVK